MKMSIPTQTAEIFKILSKGQFINSNSSNKTISRLFQVIEENFDQLYDYFCNINFQLQKGDEYFYFSRLETKADLENKIETAFKWIDVVDFLKTFDNTFSVGYRFSTSDILVKIKTDAELESKLERLKKYAGKENYHDIIDKILKDLINDTFIELENEISNSYKVLNSFKYLEQMILTINISEDINNEIPE
jgi:hypothetical protein